MNAVPGISLLAHFRIPWSYGILQPLTGDPTPNMGGRLFLYWVFTGRGWLLWLPDSLPGHPVDTLNFSCLRTKRMAFFPSASCSSAYGHTCCYTPLSSSRIHYLGWDITFCPASKSELASALSVNTTQHISQITHYVLSFYFLNIFQGRLFKNIFAWTHFQFSFLSLDQSVLRTFLGDFLAFNFVSLLFFLHAVSKSDLPQIQVRFLTFSPG